jgi:DNA-binding IclR family transcriptional regulator
MSTSTLPNGTVQVLERALDILEALVGAPGGLGISEISGITQLPVSTVHRLLKVLKKRGYADQNPETRKYHVQNRLGSVATAVPEEGRVGIASGHASLGDGHYRN